jgi:hypothetical protein
MFAEANTKNMRDIGMKGVLLHQRACNTIQSFIICSVQCTDRLDRLYDDAEDNRTAVGELSIYNNQAKL